jgi:hypothetical protein
MRQPASIGDALILMTKAVFGTVILALVVAGLWLWNDGRHATARGMAQSRIMAEAKRLAELDGEIADTYKRRLMACATRLLEVSGEHWEQHYDYSAERLLTDEEFEQAVPPPPPGFVIEERPQ